MKRDYTISFVGIVQRILSVCAFIFALVVFCASEGCRIYRPGDEDVKGYKKRTVMMEVTGYDSGPKSCGWTRNWRGQPVIASGPNKGKPKVVGKTASGTMAKHGTIAADTKYYPFGTVLYVPGYGFGRVEDRGGAIKGPTRLDLWFSTEREALKWGRKYNVPVTVYYK